MKKQASSLKSAKRYLFFCVGEERFGIEISWVLEMVPFSGAIPLPRAANFILGMMNLRGRNIPIVDLSKRLGIPKRAANPFEVVILVRFNEIEAGFLVDEVDEVGSEKDELLSAQKLDSLEESYAENIIKERHQQAVVILKPEVLLKNLILS